MKLAKVSHTPIENYSKASLLMLLSVLGSSSMMMVVKLAAVDFPLIEIVFFRSIVALVFYIFLGMYSKPVSIYQTKNIKTHLLHSFLGLAAMFFFYYSFVVLPVSEATSISFSVPLFVSVFAYFLLKEKPSRLSWAAIIFGFLGVIVVMNPSISAFDANTVYPIVSSVFCALALLCLRFLGGRESSLTTSFYYSLFSSLILLPFLPFIWVKPTHFDLFLLCLLGVGGAIEQILATQSFKHAPASFLSPISYTAIIWNSVFAYFIWNEIPAIRTYVGVFIILSSTCYLINHNIKENKQNIL